MSSERGKHVVVHFSIRISMLVTFGASVTVCGVDAKSSAHVGLVDCPRCLEIIKAFGYK